jgi:hypothetical protein
MFTRSYSRNKKRQLINGLLNLSEVKFGSIFDDEMYLALKKDKVFYRARMFLVENVYNNPDLRKEESEELIKEKIQRMI